MGLYNTKSFKEHLKKGELDNLYFLYGDESYILKQYEKKLISLAVSDDDKGFNFNLFDDRGFKVDLLADAVYLLPLMSDKKCVLVKDVDVNGLSQSEFDKLKELVSDLPETTVVIFSCINTEVNLKTKWKSFISLCEKYGSVVEVKRLDRSDIVKIVCHNAKMDNGIISQATAGYLVDKSGGDINQILNELDKLLMFTSGSEITREHIDKLITSEIDSTVFELSKAIIKNNFNIAIEKLDALFYNKEEPVAIISAISMAFIDIYRIKCANASNKRTEDVLKDFDYKGREFRLKYAADDSRRYSTGFIRKVLNELSSTDEALKSLKTDSRVLLEQMMIKIFIERAKEA